MGGGKANSKREWDVMKVKVKISERGQSEREICWWEERKSQRERYTIKCWKRKLKEQDDRVGKRNSNLGRY